MSRINLDMFLNKNEITRDEFEVIEKSEKYEIYRQESVVKFIEDGSDLLEKGENNELTEEGQKQLDLIKSEVNSLTAIIVRNNDLSATTYYIREKTEEGK